jgi:hypothetical protein
MSFVRPEVTRAFSRWRETLVGLGVAAFGALLVLTSYGLVWGIGVVLAVAGALLALAGIQRARFRRGGEGPGLVQVLEGQVTYFGPFGGGSVSAGDLSRIDLEPGGSASAAWVVTAGYGDSLRIPVDAAGAEALFDVFAGLPGLDTEAMLKTLENSPRQRVTVWERTRTLLH